jgi:hypothetical protein
VATKTKSSEADAFSLFEQITGACGVEAGPERLGVLLALPEKIQHQIFVGIASRLDSSSDESSEPA